MAPSPRGCMLSRIIRIFARASALSPRSPYFVAPAAVLIVLLTVPGCVLLLPSPTRSFVPLAPSSFFLFPRYFILILFSLYLPLLTGLPPSLLPSFSPPFLPSTSSLLLLFFFLSSSLLLLFFLSLLLLPPLHRIFSSSPSSSHLLIFTLVLASLPPNCLSFSLTYILPYTTHDASVLRQSHTIWHIQFQDLIPPSPPLPHHRIPQPICTRLLCI